jgi:hypothetical protein
MIKHKPMLFNRLSLSKPGRYREIIGLIGTQHGVGVTHTGILLAFYYGEELGMKTALLECNKHRDMRLIRQAYEWDREEDNYFSFRNITCYQEVTPEQIPQIMGEDYDCIIMDFGTELSSNREELLRCSTKIIIGGHSELDILKLHNFIKQTEVIQGSEHWLCYLVQAKEHTLQRLRNELKQKIWAVPEVEEPTRMNNSVRLFLKQCITHRE